MPIRFRTQDTKASWARKINELLAEEGTLSEHFREVPQTLFQWQTMLNELVVAAIAADYPAEPTLFRLGETRQLWTRKLNKLAEAIEAGPTPPGP